MHDIFIIGGGINGCGIARDAAGRGYSVFLAEMNDLANGTSSGSTKLIHGGLRYLEYYEFRLVREALMERERLWKCAPHIIRPLRLVLPHHKGLRPAWLLRLGLFLDAGQVYAQGEPVELPTDTEIAELVGQITETEHPKSLKEASRLAGERLGLSAKQVYAAVERTKIGQ